MTPEYVHHLHAVRRAASGGADHFSSFAEVCGTHDRRGYDGELFHILAAEVIEAMDRASGDAQCLAGTNLDGRPLNRPGEDTLDTVENLLVGVVCTRNLIGEGQSPIRLRLRMLN